jgi:hypothetical protein
MSDESLLEAKRRRLAELRKRAALTGADTQPHITLEIEDIQREIASLIQEKSALQAPIREERNKRPTSKLNRSAPVLAIFPEPISQQRTEWLRETRELRNIFWSASNQRYRLNEITHCTPTELNRALIYLKPTILHLHGHGHTTQGILMESLDGDTDFVTWEALNTTLSVSDSLECVVLNVGSAFVLSQYGSQHYHMITARENISTDATREFSRGFYTSLVSGRDFKRAYQDGISQLALTSISRSEWPIFTEASPTPSL